MNRNQVTVPVIKWIATTRMRPAAIPRDGGAGRASAAVMARLRRVQR
jgi:hypothetical protein